MYMLGENYLASRPDDIILFRKNRGEGRGRKTEKSWLPE